MGIRTDLNEVQIYGKPGMQDVFWAASALYQAVQKRGYQDIVLDFRESESVFERFVLPIACLATYYRQEFSVTFELRKPKEGRLGSLFHNANWSHLIDPENNEETTFDGTQHVPAVQFFTPEDHFKAVDRVLDAVLGTLPDLSRDSLKALKWSLDEITDNVLGHSESKVGGFLQATTFTQSGCVEFVVADAGVGIPKSLGFRLNQSQNAMAVARATPDRKLAASLS